VEATPKPLHQHLGAVMPGANRHAFLSNMVARPGMILGLE
jgi:hypothetical protein